MEALFGVFMIPLMGTGVAALIMGGELVLEWTVKGKRKPLPPVRKELLEKLLWSMEDYDLSPSERVMLAKKIRCA